MKFNARLLIDERYMYDTIHVHMIFLFIKREKGVNGGNVRSIQFRCMACAITENPVPRIIYSFAFRCSLNVFSRACGGCDSLPSRERRCAKTTESADKLCVIVVIGHNSYSRKVWKVSTNLKKPSFPTSQLSSFVMRTDRSRSRG